MWLLVSVVIVLLVFAGIGVAMAQARDGRSVGRDDELMMTFEDGIMEIAAGVMLIIASAMMFSDRAAFIGIAVPIIYVMVLSTKRAVTAPRLGAIANPSAALYRRRMVMLALTGLLVLGLTLFILMVELEPSSLVRGLVIGAALGGVAVACVAVGVRHSSIRAVAYGVFMATAGILASFVSFEFPWWVAIFGAALLIGGLIQLIRFVRRHPLPGRVRVR